MKIHHRDGNNVIARDAQGVVHPFRNQKDVMYVPLQAYLSLLLFLTHQLTSPLSVQHMTCSMCKTQWCWVCGRGYFIHPPCRGKPCQPGQPFRGCSCNTPMGEWPWAAISAIVGIPLFFVGILRYSSWARSILWWLAGWTLWIIGKRSSTILRYISAQPSTELISNGNHCL
jgi:hypothetical protein